MKRYVNMSIFARREQDLKRAIWMLDYQIQGPADLIKFWIFFPNAPRERS